jgi:pilus assembly protein CpaB
MSRRRALLMLVVAGICGVLAAADVHRRDARARAGAGPLVPVVVARSELRPGKAIGRGELAVRQAPARFVPPDALADPADAAGLKPAVPLPGGSYVTASALGSRSEAGARAPAALAPGERAVDVTVVAPAGPGALGEPGSRVDLLVTTASRGGPGRTYVALQDVELLALRRGGGEGEDAGHVTATLRVTVRQAVYITAAENFAQEVRLLPRPDGDRRSGSSHLSVAGSQL